MQGSTVSLSRIRLGQNPRLYFDDQEMADLELSIKAQGLLQPILIRPVDDAFELVTGGRRYRAMTKVFGPDYEAPVLIREMDEFEARAAALAENAQRANVSPGEEAQWASEMLGLVNNDRDEASRRMGWTRATLDRRLALMNCDHSVIVALARRKIQLGHAELLAVLPKEKQVLLLPVVTNESKTVAELRRVIEQAACALESAIFDKSDCASCPHNSALQTEMFGESIATGNCTNRICYTGKTEQAVNVIAEGLRDAYPVVRIVRPGEKFTRVQLIPDGPKGVGVEQAKACHACKNYGAAVSGLPDTVGRVYRGQCFDTVCNMKMVSKQLKAESASRAAAPQAALGKTSSSKTTSVKGAKVTADSSPVTTVAESDRVKTYRVGVWRAALRKDIGMNVDLAREYLLAIALTGNARKVKEDTLRSLYEKVTKQQAETLDIAKSAAAVALLSADQQTTLIIATCFAGIQGLEVAELVSLCRHHKLNLGKHWSLSKELLEMITKSEMLALADEIGIAQALGDNCRKTFAKPKTELIEALLAVEGFDYFGKVPKVMQF
ncbi:PRTRC system ParB family protein [Robbsia andropogonis]|uniref:PRTRC system ParB family protein n=1 Tax=Robbsia andropogonis TaxID=28092 RepID=UPI00209C816F|nr:PRTRC system ParB family protein [Robbsia andropogonis]MCP1121027.1 PRTRC system ParB family protein [Robbsia andropogonis]MCP1130792.1 PRTRC system ParB family protein [Robbsia andropogonis]